MPIAFYFSLENNLKVILFPSYWVEFYLKLQVSNNSKGVMAAKETVWGKIKHVKNQYKRVFLNP